jgi:hypothetical protein
MPHEIRKYHLPRGLIARGIRQGPGARWETSSTTMRAAVCLPDNSTPMHSKPPSSNRVCRHPGAVGLADRCMAHFL